MNHELRILQMQLQALTLRNDTRGGYTVTGEWLLFETKVAQSHSKLDALVIRSGGAQAITNSIEYLFQHSQLRASPAATRSHRYVVDAPCYISNSR